MLSSVSEDDDDEEEEAEETGDGRISTYRLVRGRFIWKKTDYHLQCATCACCVVSSFRLLEEASLDMCLGAFDGERVDSTG